MISEIWKILSKYFTPCAYDNRRTGSVQLSSRTATPDRFSLATDGKVLQQTCILGSSSDAECDKFLTGFCHPCVSQQLIYASLSAELFIGIVRDLCDVNITKGEDSFGSIEPRHCNVQIHSSLTLICLCTYCIHNMNFAYQKNSYPQLNDCNVEDDSTPVHVQQAVHAWSTCM